MMKKKLLTVLFTLTLVISAAVSTAAVSGAWTREDYGSDYTGQDCTTNMTAASTINYLMSKYSDGSAWTLGGECWGFAEKVNEFLASDNDTKKYKGLKNTQESFKEKCFGLKAGTHLRFGYEKEFDSWSGHSVILLSATEEMIYWADNNYRYNGDPGNIVRYYSGTIDDFFAMYGQYPYLTMIQEPTKYKTYSTSKLSSKASFEEKGIKLTWLRTTYTSKYEVYRSEKKSGPYKKIATTTAKTYFDKDVELGKQAYYKIKSIRSKGNTLTGYVTNRVRLEAPSIKSVENRDGKIRITWSAVKGADRYKLYRSIDGGKEERIWTTRYLSYTHEADEEATYQYRVKAMVNDNSGAESTYSVPASVTTMVLPIPTGLSGTTDSNNHLTLTWNPVQKADGYYLYCCREADGEYWREATIKGKTTYLDTDRKPENDRYYYKIAAYNKKTGVTSEISDWLYM